MSREDTCRLRAEEHSVHCAICSSSARNLSQSAIFQSLELNDNRRHPQWKASPCLFQSYFSILSLNLSLVLHYVTNYSVIFPQFLLSPSPHTPPMIIRAKSRWMLQSYTAGQRSQLNPPQKRNKEQTRGAGTNSTHIILYCAVNWCCITNTKCERTTRE